MHSLAILIDFYSLMGYSQISCNILYCFLLIKMNAEHVTVLSEHLSQIQCYVLEEWKQAGRMDVMVTLVDHWYTKGSSSDLCRSVIHVVIVITLVSIQNYHITLIGLWRLCLQINKTNIYLRLSAMKTNVGK